MNKSYYDSLNMLKMALLDTRKWAEKVVAGDEMAPEAAAYLWNTITGLQWLVRDEAKRVESLMPIEEDSGE